MRIRPGRGRSLAAGIGALLVTFLGCAMLSSFGGMMGGMGGPGMGTGPRLSFGPAGVFAIVWMIVGLVGAGVAFYNAFSRKGVALYEIDVEPRTEDAGDGAFCPQCGRPVEAGSRFCRHCGTPLE